MMPPPPSFDAAFAALRARLGIRTVFHADHSALPFVTIDPPGEEVINRTPVLS
jgi:hypothetical protein